MEDKLEYQNYIVSNGDLLLAMSGATTGKLGIYLDNKKVFQNQRVGNLKIIDEDICFPKFRNYLFFLYPILFCALLMEEHNPIYLARNY